MKKYFKAWVYYKYIQSICLHIQMSDWSQIKHKTDRKPIYIYTYTLQTRLYTVTGHIKCQNIDIDLYRQGVLDTTLCDSLSVTCDRSVVFSGYSGFLRHDMAEILLKVALNTITIKLWFWFASIQSFFNNNKKRGLICPLTHDWWVERVRVIVFNAPLKVLSWSWSYGSWITTTCEISAYHHLSCQFIIWKACCSG
jgi:hypothetical protein